MIDSINYGALHPSVKSRIQSIQSIQSEYSFKDVLPNDTRAYTCRNSYGRLQGTAVVYETREGGNNRRVLQVIFTDTTTPAAAYELTYWIKDQLQHLHRPFRFGSTAFRSGLIWRPIK